MAHIPSLHLLGPPGESIDAWTKPSGIPLWWWQRHMPGDRRMRTPQANKLLSERYFREKYEGTLEPTPKFHRVRSPVLDATVGPTQPMSERVPIQPGPKRATRDTSGVPSFKVLSRQRLEAPYNEWTHELRETHYGRQYPVWDHDDGVTRVRSFSKMIVAQLEKDEKGRVLSAGP